MNRLMLVGVAVAALAAGAIVLVLWHRQQLDEIVKGAKAEAKEEIISGAAQVAAAADHELAAARDPDAADKALAQGTF
jgi:hypothetical protein